MKKFQSRSFQKSLSYALNGVRLAFRSQRNFRKHLVIAFLTFAIAFFLRVEIVEFCIILFANVLVLVCEMFNSVIEFVIDAYYKNKWAKLAKLSKDIGAGAVLISACVSALISLLIFGSKIYQLYYI
ncbi:MAG: diacylglycerol kinase family protein [Candidatus Gastranaerophilales bacterium]|nr:diacylglycerol kinase family protein [Candidatus Gastranaerophilales bacterium]